jgi:hypothetical protein
MLNDIVVDTNVFVHADHGDESRKHSAIAFLTALQASNTSICVDEGFDLDEAKNASLIAYEYLKHLRAGMLGFAIVAHLAQNQRVRMLSRKVRQSDKQGLERKIANKRDRTFVMVAINSHEQHLVSHDFDDFPSPIRTWIKNELDVLVLTASESLPYL